MSDLATLLETWEPVIGLEVHVQLGTASKAFSPSAIEFGQPPNSLTDPTVLGLPGTLPVFNREALAMALKLGVATASKIRAKSRFARKHYFYPDLPKGYQISQYDEPLCEDGHVDFMLATADGSRVEKRSVRLVRIHLEEDAGKNTHAGATSLVDLNRAGVPLCEVVTGPDVRSADEAAEFMRALNLLVRYLGISEGDMEKGQMRCDANVSVRRRGEDRFGTRTELKNINSFRFVHKAIEHELARQIRILEGGGRIVQETRLWDADKGQSFSLRSKEEANDYRYFPDPDLPPLVVDGPLMRQVQESLPELPMAKLERFTRDLGLPLEDARQLTADRALADWFDAAVAAHGDLGSAKAIANWVLSELGGALNREGKSLAEAAIQPGHVAALVKLVESGTISGKQAKDLFAEVYASGESPDALAEKKGLRQISDAGEIERIVADIIAKNPKQTEQYRAGKDGLLGFFVGQVMKATGGKANPQVTSDVLKKLLAGG
jgi:aspartyl-tRNA(Asn)/glutamyl-tRNA(Gln) amidotransferase subunit B